MDKYRPESKQQKKARLQARAAERAKGKDDVPTKRQPQVRSGVNTVTTLVEQKKAQMVIIAHDVDPIEVMCRPYKILLNKLLLAIFCVAMMLEFLHLKPMCGSKTSFLRLSKHLHSNFKMIELLNLY